MNKVDMASLPVQLPADPQGPAAARARFFNSGNAFNIKLAPVPAAVFPAPQLREGEVACDQAAALGCDFPATSPLMLARYLALPAGGAKAMQPRASAVIAHVMRGAGRVAVAGEAIEWAAGDVLLLPGGGPMLLSASADALLWLVGNEPALAFEQLDSLTPVVRPVHYPAAEIERQLALLDGTFGNSETSGHALIFSSEGLEPWRNISPSLTLSLNTLPPGEYQRPHRHNSAAITLVLRGEACHSRIAGTAWPWEVGATMVTPPGAPHSHHNEGPTQARFLIVQDGGLHYHARTMDFVFLAPG